MTSTLGQQRRRVFAFEAMRPISGFRILASFRVESPMSLHEEEGKRYDLAQLRSIGA